MAAPTVKEILDRLATEGVSVTSVAGELIVKARSNQIGKPRIAGLLAALRSKLKSNPRLTITQILQSETTRQRREQRTGQRA